MSNERAAKALFLLLNAVPCILHAENRMGIKMLTMLLVEGLSAAMKNSTGSEKKGAVEFLAKIEKIMNKQIFGDEDNEAQWQCAVADNKKEIGQITMSNVRTRKVVECIRLLIPLCVVGDDERLQKWMSCICDNYTDMVHLLTQHQTLTPEEICEFQQAANSFYAKWIDLHEKSEVTNYIHMVASGHFAEYIQHWGNLYQHSQQGWEAFNNLIKKIYFRRTQRGGRSGDGSKTRLVPIARWLQRRMIWMSGEASYEEMKEVVNERA